MQLAIYLIALWIIVTLVATSKYGRRNGLVILVWLAITSVMLWPVIRRATPHVRAAYNSPLVQSVVTEAKAELDAELRAEFPEIYDVR